MLGLVLDLALGPLQNRENTPSQNKWP
jgi:hypothetical protein